MPTTFSIESLKKHLGPGLGLRKNKYMLEIPVPGIDGAKLNVLARSAGLPERTITTVNMFHKGRQYNVRGETDYGTTYDVSIVDDSNMDIRKRFDAWLKLIDDSKPANAGMFAGGSYETGIGQALDAIRSGVGLANQIKSFAKTPVSDATNFFLGVVDPGLATPTAKYQTDINIWQLSVTGDNVYGYKLQNAFPTQIGIVSLDDGNPNTLSEFTITFTFSEFVPLEGISPPSQIFDALIGTAGQDIKSGIETLVR